MSEYYEYLKKTEPINVSSIFIILADNRQFPIVSNCF